MPIGQRRDHPGDQRGRSQGPGSVVNEDEIRFTGRRKCQRHRFGPIGSPGHDPRTPTEHQGGFIGERGRHRNHDLVDHP